MYGDLGRKISNQVWRETMEELRFAGVDEILKVHGRK